MQTSYAVLFERTDTGFSCYAPDIPGCYAAGETLEETRRLIAEGIAFHMEGMLLDGEAVSEPTTYVEMISVDVPDHPPVPDPYKVIYQPQAEAVA